MTTSANTEQELSARLGITRLAVPTPFAVGPINAYLLEDDSPTLIDTGPNVATSLVDLERRLDALGCSPRDLGAIIVTHLHVDHLGLAGALAERSGAAVICLARASDSARDFDAYARRNDEYAAEMMLRHGVEPDVVRALRSMSALTRAFGAPLEPTVTVEDGDVLELGSRRLTVHDRPGHSPFDIVLVDEEHRLLFSGDHLLSNVSSNALLTRPVGEREPTRRPRPLLDYRASLLATRDLDCVLGLGGHGPLIPDPAALIDARIAEQDQRAERIARLLSHGPLSGHELACRIWGDGAVTEAFLTISEVLGHLDLLIAAGLVVECEGEPVRFVRV